MQTKAILFMQKINAVYLHNKQQTNRETIKKLYN